MCIHTNCDDDIAENEESFTVSLEKTSDLNNRISLSPDTTLVTILDDDGNYPIYTPRHLFISQISWLGLASKFTPLLRQKERFPYVLMSSTPLTSGKIISLKCRDGRSWKQGVAYPIPTSLFSQIQHLTHSGMNHVARLGQ